MKKKKLNILYIKGKILFAMQIMKINSCLFKANKNEMPSYIIGQTTNTFNNELTINHKKHKWIFYLEMSFQILYECTLSYENIFHNRVGFLYLSESVENSWTEASQKWNEK